ncbi:two-component sensor histidine kinase [Acrocarpospora corrugata]|uniref:Signal transduction histidine-protein kinase/phosphatase MprB n=1 Tax=Acrocarpospora corrugata TaxID=35763 RepID=A0A5M3W9Y8_9ACTN|nr:HAMP domain-containing sensor histidine kinase [Acrocarpospora corrugata]GES03318.1 two-component sensor histidine kinase [Acrocarpospora corrugata]
MRRRLALLVTATTSLVLIAMLVPMALLVRSAAENGAVAQATTEAQSVAALIGTVDLAALALTANRSSAANGHQISVFLPDGTVVGASTARSPAVELAARGRSLSAEAPGGGREILVAVQGETGTSVVRVLLTADDLSRGVQAAWLGLLLLGLTLIGVGMLIADRLAVALTRPMTGLAHVSHRLAGGDLAARAAPTGPPEIRAAALALNHLATRIDDLLHEERESVADISHRLRTPLTGLRLEAESLTDPEEAERLGGRVDALDRAVTSVIVDVRRRTRERGSCDATTVVAARVTFWSVLAEEQNRPLTLTLPDTPLPVATSADDLAATVDALLENVFAHTPEGVPMSVRLTPTPSGAELAVTDSGPGMRTEALERGRSGGDSTGLGLDIARRTAQSAGGTMTLTTPPNGGTTVTLTFATP